MNKENPFRLSGAKLSEIRRLIPFLYSGNKPKKSYSYILFGRNGNRIQL
jgi:hypothetical protein